jgi:GMP synthase (glutamine-hydrolysing)
MRPILMVKNDPLETFGIAERAFSDAGTDVRILDATDPAAPRPALEEVAGVVMFGGTMNVDEVDDHPFLKENRDLTREAVERGVPYLGLCLGAQLLARAMDAPVMRAPVKEVGFEPIHPLAAAASDPLLGALADGDMAFQWHQDTMELPSGAEQLVAGERVALQAFRIGPSAWATQFHLEIDAEELELWLDEASRFMDLEEVWGKSPHAIRAEAMRHMDDHEARGSEIFRRFARIAGAATES